MSPVAIACRFTLFLVFVASASGKVRNDAFSGFVTTLRVLRLAPAAWARPLAFLVVAGEAVAAGLLVVWSTAGLALSGLLLLVFCVAIEVAVRRGVKVPCRCFGSSADLLSRRHLVRNGMLLALVALGLAASGPDADLAGLVFAAVTGISAAALVIRFDDLVVLVAGPTEPA